MNASREMTLKEYVEVLPDIHLAHKQYTDLEAKLKVAVEALGYYASESNWSKPYMRQGKQGYQVKEFLHIDGGNSAREAIEKIKAKQ